MREPSVEPAQRGRHAVAGSEQTEDPACGTAGIETGREPSCAEILGNDTMNVSKPTFIVCLKEACPERIFDRRAEWQLSYIGNIDAIVGRSRVGYTTFGLQYELSMVRNIF